MKRLYVIALSTFFFIGCEPTTIVLLKSEKSQNAVVVSTNKGSANLDKIGSFVTLTDKEEKPSEVKIMSQKEISRRFAKALAAAPKKPIQYILYFTPDNKSLIPSSEKLLLKAVNSIKERSPCMVDIIGHTDTVGSNELNIKVSLQRAKYIEIRLKEKAIQVISLATKGYGEEDLLILTPDNTSEPKNRNVEILIK